MTEHLTAGNLFEQEVFGPKAVSGPLPFDYSVRDAIRWVIRRQRRLYDWNPASPPTDLGKKIFQAVKNRIEPRHGKHLRFYVAIGTTLDCYWGMDAFFKLFDHVVSCDITTANRKKARADVIVRKYDFQTDSDLNLLAEHIAKRLYCPISKLASLKQPPEQRRVKMADRFVNPPNVGKVRELRKLLQLDD